VKALDLVRKVSKVSASLRDKDGRKDVGQKAAVSVLKVTTALARQMQRVPFPRASAAERGALALAAAPLRQMATQLPEAPDGTPEAAMAELVRETLVLVDRLLEGDAELPREPAPRAELPETSPDATRRKVRF
jgi:hypothetical protein